MIKIENVNIYGLEDSIRASKFPMATDASLMTSEPTNTTKSLFHADVGSGHDVALNGIIVQFDLTMPIKMSTELQRYHFIDFVSSESTMHRITKFNIKDRCDSHVDSRIIDILQEKVNEYNRLKILQKENRIESREEILKELYLDILMSVPCGFNLTARMTTNYRQLKTMYYQRENHPLPGWHEFCDWCETLPLFKEFVLGE